MKAFNHWIVLVTVAAVVAAALLIVLSSLSSQSPEFRVTEREQAGENSGPSQSLPGPPSNADPDSSMSSPTPDEGGMARDWGHSLDQPTLGSRDAPVTLVEFAEFYCPFCARYLLETFPKIEHRYIETGLVRYQFRNLPVHGEPAWIAAAAGECAHDQGSFWSYHDRLFALKFGSGTGSGHGKLDVDRLIEAAAELGLEVERFRTCLQEYQATFERCSHEYSSCIESGGREEDCAEALYACAGSDGTMAELIDDQKALERMVNRLPADERARAQELGTPTFFVNNHILIGAYPFEEFERLIERELERKAGDR